MQKNRDEFIEENLGLVRACASKFKGKGIEYDDLYQAGCVGLVKAVGSFDESYGNAFSTYAVPVILGEIKRMFRDGGIIKVSRQLKELSLKVTRYTDDMLSRTGKAATVNELALAFGVSKEEVADAICVSSPVTSLTYEDENGVCEVDVTDKSESENFERLFVKQLLSELEEEDRKIIELRYFSGYTQSETAKALSTTQVGISRKEKKILRKLRGNIEPGKTY